MGGQVTSEMQWRRAPAPGSFLQISCGGFNVYAIDSMQQFWKLDINSISDCNWTKMAGNGTYIDGTEGKQLWCVNGNGEIFYFYHGWTSNRWEKIDGSLVMISVGKGQYIWGINSAGEIFKTNESSKKWTKMPGYAQNLAVGRDGSCWCVNAQCEVFRWVSKNFAGFDGHWQQMPGSLRQISVYDDHTVVGTNMNDDIWYWDRNVNDWRAFTGKLKHVSVGATNYGHVWGVNSQGEVWYHRDQAKDDFLVRHKQQMQNPHGAHSHHHHHDVHHHSPTHTPVGYQVTTVQSGYPAAGGVQVSTGYPGAVQVSTGYPAGGVQVSTGYPAAGGIQVSTTGYPAGGGVQVSTYGAQTGFTVSSGYPASGGYQA